MSAERPQLRVGVVGAGWGAGLHLEGFRRTGRVQLTALTSRTRGNAERTAERFGVGKVVDSLEELVELVDVVCVASPPHVHHEATMAAVAAGRHVLCDKPLAVDLAEAEQMLSAADEANVRHATGFIWRLDPAMARLRAAVAAGDVGRPLEAQTTCAMGVPVLPHSWLYEEERGGGALMQHGTHVIDRVRYVLGDEIASLSAQLHHDVSKAKAGPDFHNVLDVFAYARDRAQAADDPAVQGKGADLRPVTADTGYRITGRTSTGIRVGMWEAWHCVGPAEDQIVVHGDEGTLEWNGAQGLRLLRPGGRSVPMEVAGSTTTGANTPREHGLALWQGLANRFLDAIEGAGDAGRPHDESLPTLADGWQVMRVVDAVRRSHTSGRWEST